MAARTRPRSRLGRIIYEARERAGLDQRQLAEAAGTSQPRVSDLEGEPEEWERRLELLAAIGEAVGEGPGYVFHAFVGPASADTATAIKTDPDLTPRYRRDALSFYEFCREQSVKARSASDDSQLDADDSDARNSVIR